MADNPLTLRIETGGMEVLEILDQLAISMGGVSKAQDDLTRSVHKLIMSSDHISKAIDKQGGSVSKVISPWERLAKAQERYQDALKGGDAHATKHAELQLHRAEMAAQRADATLARRGDPVRAAVTDLIYGSRIKLGPLMPSIGAIARMGASGGGGTGGGGLAGLLGSAGAGAGAAGVLGVAAPVALGIGIFLLKLKLASEAVQLFARAAWESKDVLSSYGSARFVAGGGSFGRLAGLGGALGLPPGAISGMASSWAKGGWGDPLAMGAAAKAGVNITPAKYGGRGDYGDAFYQVMKTAAFMKDDRSAMQYGERAGLPMDALGLLRTASPSGRSQAFGAMQNFSRKDQERAADAQIGFNIAMMETSTLFYELGAKALPLINIGIKLLGWAVQGVWGIITGIVRGYNIHAEAWNSKFGDIIKLPTIDFGNNPAMDQNTKAIRENTGAISELSGLIGAGAQAGRGALPAGATVFENMEAYYMGQARALGAIPL